jgi:Asp-tRNA(Asn)/Glu-tRNA(Gln) amidotransferase A subunit family amidase
VVAEAFADYTAYDALGLAKLVSTGEVPPAALVAAAIDRIDEVNPTINAVVATDYERARRLAGSGPTDGPFAGVPFLLKDLVVVEGEPVTFGSVFFRDYRAEATHELVHRFQRAGLVSLGRTNTPEFGLLPTTEPLLYGPTRNPWNVEHSAGGSSGGAAAAVAAGMVPMAHASDGGGSIRIPASACGVFGLKPSRGRMPQRPRSTHDGLVAPLCVSRTVRDSAALLDAVAGPVPGDLWWAPPPAGSFLAATGADPRRLRCAFTVHDFGGARVHPEVEEGIRATAVALESLGHDVVEAAPEIDASSMADAFLMVWASFADTVFRLILGEIDERRAGRLAHRVLGDRLMMKLVTKLDERKSGRAAFEPFTWALVERSRRHTPGHLAVAQAALQEIAYAMAAFLSTYDVFVTPVLASPPARLGAIDQDVDHGELVSQLISYVAFTPLANFTGLPAMSVPMHWTREGLPVGTHVIGRFGDEETLLSLAAQLERARPWAHRHPVL